MRYPARMLVLIASLCLGVTEAQANDKQEAETHFRAGVSLQKGEDFQAAIAAFESSLRLFPTKAALFNLANCLRALHRYPEALSAFDRLQEEFGNELRDPMLATVTMQITELNHLTGIIHLEVEPAGASILVDGKPAGTAPLEKPLRVGLGEHEVSIVLDGFEPELLSLNIAPASSISRQVSLTPIDEQLVKPAPAPSGTAPSGTGPAAPAPVFATTRREQPIERDTSGSNLQLIGGVTAAAGALLLAAGATTGVWALVLDKDLQSDCSNGHCPYGRADDVDRLDSLGVTTNVLLAVGGVLAAGGAGLWWFAPEPSAQTMTTEVNIMVGAGRVTTGLRRRF